MALREIGYIVPVELGEITPEEDNAFMPRSNSVEIDIRALAAILMSLRIGETSLNAFGLSAPVRDVNARNADFYKALKNGYSYEEALSMAHAGMSDEAAQEALEAFTSDIEAQLNEALRREQVPPLTQSEA